jgi:hypothetical protein
MDKATQRRINKVMQQGGWVMRQDWCQLSYGWQSVWTLGYRSRIVFWESDNPTHFDTFERDNVNHTLL